MTRLLSLQCAGAAFLVTVVLDALSTAASGLLEALSL